MAGTGGCVTASLLRPPSPPLPAPTPPPPPKAPRPTCASCTPGDGSAQGRGTHGRHRDAAGCPSSVGPAQRKPGCPSSHGVCPCPAAGPGRSQRRNSAGPRPPAPRPPLTAEPGVLLLGADLADLERAAAERGQHKALPQEVASRVAEALRLARHAGPTWLEQEALGQRRGKGQGAGGEGPHRPRAPQRRERPRTSALSLSRHRGSFCLFLCSPSLRVSS